MSSTKKSNEFTPLPNLVDWKQRKKIDRKNMLLPMILINSFSWFLRLLLVKLFSVRLDNVSQMKLKMTKVGDNISEMKNKRDLILIFDVRLNYTHLWITYMVKCFK